MLLSPRWNLRMGQTRVWNGLRCPINARPIHTCTLGLHFPDISCSVVFQLNFCMFASVWLRLATFCRIGLSYLSILDCLAVMSAAWRVNMKRYASWSLLTSGVSNNNWTENWQGPVTCIRHCSHCLLTTTTTFLLSSLATHFQFLSFCLSCTSCTIQ